MNVLFRVMIFALSLSLNIQAEPQKTDYNLDDHALYFCTACDTQFYPRLLRQIGAIHKYDFDSLIEIAVFDLGLTAQEKATLNTIEKVKIYAIEMTNPQMLTLYNVRGATTLEKDRKARGWYSWKPVVLKQALDMFPYVLYMDSGISPLCSLKPIFEHMKREGCFLRSCGHGIREMTTNYVIKKFDLTNPENAFILDPKTFGISAGLQGVTRDVYDMYVKPMYELSKDIRNFVDDGSTPNGFGSARHDQTLFSIFAQKLHLKIMRGGMLNTRAETPYSGFFIFKTSNHKPTEQSIRYKKIKR